MPSSQHTEAFVEAKVMGKMGWSLIPIRPDTKRPAVDWKKYQEEKSRAADWLQWYDTNGWTTGLVCGQVSGVIILDIDSVGGYEWWADRLGENSGEILGSAALVHTPKVTQKGGDPRIGHYYFRYPALGAFQGGNVRSSAYHDPDTDTHWDLRSDGNQSLVPPAAGYEWVRLWDDDTPEIPAILVAVLRDTRRPTATPDATGEGGQLISLGTMRSLWSNPGVGGRNNWVAQLLGHYAKQYRNMEDMFLFEADRVFEAAAELPAEDGHPYERDEFERTRDGLWSKETGKYGADPTTGLPVRQATRENGFLIGTGTTLKIQCRYKDEEGNFKVGMEQWADFDLECLGRVVDEESERAYDVIIRTPQNPGGRRALLLNSTVTDHRKLITWLGNLGGGIHPPDNVWPRSTVAHERIRLYLEDQKAPRFQVVKSLGWDGSGFICHEGVITEDGLEPFSSRRPDPKLLNWAPYRYGFERREGEAREVLSELLTFHDETVTAVFGAWWAACILKPQIQEYSSLFPFMALEAPSESGKTTGFFSLMINLSGNTRGQTLATRAAMRDFVSAHKSGIVWIDDADDIEHLTELLRGATGEGGMTKKGEDRTAQVDIDLVAPICLSGESLGLSSQKALLDRAVQLQVPSPTKRRSLKDPSKLQWADIVAVMQRYPNHGLADLAGTLVQSVLQRRSMVADLPALTTGGRHGDKLAVLRTGARILSSVVTGSDGDTRTTELVDNWCLGRNDLGGENTLTLKIMPMALRMEDYPRGPMKGDGRKAATPAWVDKDGYVWFSTVNLAEWWLWMRSGRITERTESAGALQDQAQAVEATTKKRFDLGGDKNSKCLYRRLSRDLSERVLSRARDGHDADMGGYVGGPESNSLALGTRGEEIESMSRETLSLDLPIYWHDPG